jgi:hypothetical protein
MRFRKSASPPFRRIEQGVTWSTSACLRARFSAGYWVSSTRRGDLRRSARTKEADGASAAGEGARHRRPPHEAESQVSDTTGGAGLHGCDSGRGADRTPLPHGRGSAGSDWRAAKESQASITTGGAGLHGV